MKKPHFLLILVVIILIGCSSASKRKSSPDHLNSKETDQDVTSALQAVAGSLSGKTLSDQEVKGLARDIQKDKEAQSAIQSVTGAVAGQTVVKYCPVDGKRFSPRIKVCPEHQVELEELKN